jgi:hypothetical protein
MPDSVQLSDPVDGLVARIRDTTPAGTEPGLYVRVVSGGGLPGGGPVTVADGADVAEGTTTDAAWVSGAGTVISLLKKIASGGGSAVSIADGADVAQGTTTDPDTAFTVIGLLKKIKALLTASLTVTGPLTDAQLRASAVPVSGTVTTSPPANASTNVAQIAGTATSVNSGTKDAGTLRVVLATDQPALTNKLLVTPDSVALPANQSVNVAQLVGTATSVNSGTKDAGTLRVVLATDQPALTNKLLVTPDSVALPANQSVNVAQFGATNVVTGTGAGGVGIPRVTVSNDSNVIVTPPTLTKGTQGATGFSTQDLKDAGRVIKTYGGFHFTPATTEGLVTLTPVSDGTAGSTGTTFAVTAGKRLRLQSMSVVSRASGTTAVGVQVSLRMTASGSVSASSPLVATIGAGLIGTQVAVAASSNFITFPDGIELSGTMQFGISQIGIATAGASVTLIGYEY